MSKWTWKMLRKIAIVRKQLSIIHSQGCVQRLTWREFIDNRNWSSSPQLRRSPTACWHVSMNRLYSACLSPSRCERWLLRIAHDASSLIVYVSSAKVVACSRNNQQTNRCNNMMSFLLLGVRSFWVLRGVWNNSRVSRYRYTTHDSMRLPVLPVYSL